MSWPTGNVAPAVTAMRDMIVASATAVAAGVIQSHVHYPDCAPQVSGALPLILIVQESENRQVYASGSGALPTGRIRLEYYEDALAGSIEKNAYGIASDIAASTTGLLIRSIECGLASDPLPAETASIDDADSASFRIVTIHIDYGPQI